MSGGKFIAWKSTSKEPFSNGLSRVSALLKQAEAQPEPGEGGDNPTPGATAEALSSSTSVPAAVAVSLGAGSQVWAEPTSASLAPRSHRGASAGCHFLQ